MCNYEHQDDVPFFCSSTHGIGDTPSLKPDTNSQLHLTNGERPSILMFFMQISSNGAPSMPPNNGAFLESILTTLLINIPLTFGNALGSQFSSGWSSAPLLNLIGTLTLSIIILRMVMFVIYPPLPLSVLIRTPDAESLTYKSSTKTFLIPPDISLPIPIPEHVGVVPETRLMVMFTLGFAMFMPYWSQPLFTATRSSPLSI
ncbi:hypothetical protein CASFOL_025723 [Castilleja foliolosa]|uniref:NADH:ubiquinone reductase (H(+)-translocating) n=1 Tax=Castilleja foliolosa TaxID=1961234 RepID=A0ABD3CU95_9LAMI